MAWKTTLTLMVRHLIGDTSDTPTYDDTKIQEGLVVSGLIVSNEFPFDIDYTFDLELIDISPDPTITTTLDKEAIALFALKCACMLNINSYQTAIGGGIKVRDGDSEVDTTSNFGGYKDILNLGPCASYQKLLNKLRFDASMGIGKAVTGPASTDYSGFWGPSQVVDFYNGFCFPLVL